MTVHYEVTVQDYINFNLYHLKTSKSGKMLHMFMYRIAPLAFFVLLTLRLISLHINAAEEVPGRLFISIVLAAFAALMFCFFLKLMYSTLIKWLAKMQLKDGKSNDFIGKQTITLHDDFIEDANVQMTSRINYNHIRK